VFQGPLAPSDSAPLRSAKLHTGPKELAQAGYDEADYQPNSCPRRSPLTEAVTSQYHAALDMLKPTLAQCSDQLWTDPRYQNAFWHVAYHALFYTDLYLQASESAFTPSPLHKDNYGDLSRKDLAVLSKPDVLDYATCVHSGVPAAVDALDLAQGDSGFAWLPFSKLELQFYNIRHLQHHTGQLSDRIRNDLALPTPWIRRGEPR